MDSDEQLSHHSPSAGRNRAKGIRRPGRSGGSNVPASGPATTSSAETPLNSTTAYHRSMPSPSPKSPVRPAGEVRERGCSRQHQVVLGASGACLNVKNRGSRVAVLTTVPRAAETICAAHVHIQSRRAPLPRPAGARGPPDPAHATQPCIYAAEPRLGARPLHR
jgi:hypothetical protein